MAWHMRFPCVMVTIVHAPATARAMPHAHMQGAVTHCSYVYARVAHLHVQCSDKDGRVRQDVNSTGPVNFWWSCSNLTWRWGGRWSRSCRSTPVSIARGHPAKEYMMTPQVSLACVLVQLLPLVHQDAGRCAHIHAPANFPDPVTRAAGPAKMRNSGHLLGHFL